MSSQLANARRIIPTDPAGDRLRLLASLTQSLSEATDPESLLDSALRRIRECLDAEGAALLLWEDEGDTLICRDHDGDIGAADKKLLAEYLREIAIPTPGEVGGGPGIARQFKDGWGVPVRTVACVPMTLGRRPLGALTVVNKHGEREFDDDDVDFLRIAANAVSYALLNARAGRSFDELDATNRDIDVAATIQRSLLPDPDPERSPVLGLNRPIKKVTGDFYDYLALPDGRFPFALGDVSGKGIYAALLMAKTASLFRCLAKTIDDPAELLRAMNREICETAARGMFVTMVAGVYDPVSGSIRFANAGHEPPLLRLPDRSYRSFQADAPPLGILQDIEIETCEVGIDGGEFYIFSDGLTEFTYGEDEQLGVTGLIQMVEVSSATPLADRLEAVLGELEADGWQARDDLTVLTIDGTWIRRHG
jgi:sigma-B regulation protein RsbU (phosphoserine phosphatase)